MTQTLQWVALFLALSSVAVVWYFIRQRLVREKLPNSKRQAWNLGFLAVLVALVASLTLLRHWTLPGPLDFIIALSFVLFGLFLTMPKGKVITPVVLFSVAFTLQGLSTPLLQSVSRWSMWGTILLSIVIDGGSIVLFVMFLAYFVRNSRL